GLARLVDAMGMPGRVLEGPAAIMGRVASAAPGRVGDLPDAVDHPGWRLRDERTGPTSAADEMSGDMPELGREVLVYEEDVHRLTRINRPAALGSSRTHPGTGPSVPNWWGRGERVAALPEREPAPYTGRSTSPERDP